MTGVPERVRALLAERARGIAGALSSALSVPLPEVPEGASFVVTGVGCSEGPARAFALLLQMAGRRAVFAPLSTFVGVTARGMGNTLVLFSQGLSPNARLALRRAGEFEGAILFTSVRRESAAIEAREQIEAFEAGGGRVVTLPPEEESGTFVRVVGPAAALLAVARFAGSVSKRVDASEAAKLPALAASADARVEELVSALPAAALHRRLAFVAWGPWIEAARGLPCKWLEGVGAAEPALWDVFQIAHGPFQQFYDEEITLVTLEHDGEPEARALFDRLAAMVEAPRHAMLRLSSPLPPAIAAVDHDVLVTALLVRAIGERSKDLGRAEGADAALYDVGR